jgi:hypothetical protein
MRNTSGFCNPLACEMLAGETPYIWATNLTVSPGCTAYARNGPAVAAIAFPEVVPPTAVDVPLVVAEVPLAAVVPVPVVVPLPTGVPPPVVVPPAAIADVPLGVAPAPAPVCAEPGCPAIGVGPSGTPPLTAG